MSYSLNFAPEFFHAPGEPDDAAPAVDSHGNPTSLFSSLCQLLECMTREDVEGLAELAELAGSHPEASDLASRVVELAQRTDTCSHLESPVEVWLDPQGDFRAFVHGSDH